MTAIATQSAAQPDFTTIKTRQQATWASGNFAVVAARIVVSAEQLCESAGLQAGWKVLDVATGSGNAALAAARRGCDVTGVDYVPALLERGRIRAEAGGEFQNSPSRRHGNRVARQLSRPPDRHAAKASVRDVGEGQGRG